MMISDLERLVDTITSEKNIPRDVGRQVVFHFFEWNVTVTTQNPPAFADVILV